MILGSRWAVTKIRVKRLVRRRVKWDTLGSALKALGVRGCHGEQMESLRKSWENHGKIQENHGKIQENHGKFQEKHGKTLENHGEMEGNHEI